MSPSLCLGQAVSQKFRQGCNTQVLTGAVIVSYYPNMPYEVFSQKQHRIQQPAVSLHPAGRIYFNQEATSQLQTAGVKRILLLWDKERLQLALKSATKSDKRAYNVAFSHKGSGATITAKQFLKWINYDTAPGTLTLEAAWNDKENMFEVTVPREKIGKVGSVRSRKDRGETE